MKKHLIAAAVAAAVAVPAMAQNVTISGVMDGGWVKTTNTNATGQSTSAINSGIRDTSRLSFRGSEDLGGGWTGSFYLEGALSIDSGGQGAGTAGATGETNNFKPWDRNATVGLASKSLGSVDIGRQNIPMVDAIAPTDPLGFTYAGYNPNVAYMALNALPNSSTYGPASQLVSTTNGSLLRADNSVKYKNTFSGVNVSLLQGWGESATGTAAGKSTGASAVTTFAGITVSYGYSKVNNATLNSGNLKGNVIGLAYPVPFVQGLTLKATSGSQKYSADAITATGSDKVTTDSLGASYDVSPSINVTLAHYANKYMSTTAANAGDLDATALALTYSMSKRTAVYGMFMDRKYSGGASQFRAAGLTESDKLTSLGLRHSF